MNSWLSQIELDLIQVIVVHDKKDEFTGPELEQIISDHNEVNISLISGFFGDPGSARNAGFISASGRWIAFWDSDDLPILDNFLAMVKQGETLGSAICIGSFVTRNEISGSKVRQSIPPTNQDELPNYLKRECGIWRFAFRREILENVTFPSLSMAEDQVFLCRTNFMSYSILSFSDAVYEYYVGGALHLTKSRKAMKDLIQASRLTLKIKEYPTSKTFIKNLAIRQLFSAIKYGSVSIRFLSIKELLANLLFRKLDFGVFIDFFRKE